MSKEKLSNNKVEVVKESEMRINLDFFNFIKEVRNIEDINLIKNKYNEIVNLNWSNRKNIIKRSNREEVKDKRELVLKNLGVKEEEYNKVIDKIRVNKVSNYF